VLLLAIIFNVSCHTIISVINMHNVEQWKSKQYLIHTPGQESM